MAGFTLDRWAKLKAEVGEDEELRRRLALLSPGGQRLWAERCRARVAAGEPIDGLPWRALVDVRLVRVGTPDGWSPLGR